jgi:AbiV family abortive infection protein
MTTDIEIILENGRNHMKAAEKLANEKYFGFAIAHLVLGAEELIKYMVFVYYRKRPSPISELDIFNVFSDHKTKLRFWQEFNSMLSEQFERTYIEALFMSLSNERLGANHEEALANRFRDLSSIFTKLKPRLGLSSENYRQFLVWISSANNQKKNGFYVDKNADRLNSPQQMDKTNYEKVLKYATLLENSASEMTTVFDSIEEE